jgi:hypothetical protein
MTELELTKKIASEIWEEYGVSRDAAFALAIEIRRNEIAAKGVTSSDVQALTRQIALLRK